MEDIEQVGHRKLRENLSPLLRRLTKSGRMAAVTNRNKVEAVLVPARAFEEWAHAKADLGRLRQVMPLLMAAVSAGVAIPSETIQALGIQFEFDWKRLNAFQAAFPIRISHGEEGHPLASMPSPRFVPMAEAEEA